MTNPIHAYAVFDHDRAQIGRYLGLGSILVSGLTAQLISLAYKTTSFEAIATATLSTGAA